MKLTIGHCKYALIVISLLVLVVCNNQENKTYIILSAKLVSPPLVPFSSVGDLWMSTWADDDNIYITWGDGCGPGQTWGDPYFNALNCDAGVAVLRGAIPDFTNCTSPFDCVRSIMVPDGMTGWGDSLLTHDDKPSSILFYNGRLYFAGHTPLGDPNYGYVAYSDDYGLHWTEAPNSPWTKQSNSVFRCIFFINMGKNYELNTDGYVYALGIGTEWGWLGPVYLCRVPEDSIAFYNAYRYWAGAADTVNQIWSESQFDAEPLENLYAGAMGSAMYHEGSKHYLFLVATRGLYSALNPWGPWTKVPFLSGESDSLWAGGYMPGIISKDAGQDYFYFAIAGQDPIIDYRCHLGKIELQLEEIANPDTVGS